MLPGNIFGLILKNKMAARDVYSTLNKDFCWPSRAKGIIGRDLKFAGYVPHYKILTGNIFGLILKNKMAATGVSLSVMKSAYISLIIKRPARDACLCMGDLPAPPAPPALPAPPAPHFVFLITL